MRVSLIAPVLNEVDFIGYSVMACLAQAHEFIYALDEASSDGTRELLEHIKQTYAHEKLIILPHPTFNPHDTAAYNEAFNVCIRKATGEAVAFIHPDMIVTRWADPPAGALAWWTTMTSYARDMRTVITKGRCDKWKNIHAQKLGLHYFGGYGSANEDFYFSDITAKSYRHFGTDFKKYPYAVENSGIEVNHYCELKPYRRRLEKMKLCLRTQYPQGNEDALNEAAFHHPRVTLEPSSQRFGEFAFAPTDQEIPNVFKQYADEFLQFRKEEAPWYRPLTASRS